MINFPTKDEFEIIKTFNEPFCLTLYVPFIDPNAATNPNQIEFKNILHEGETALLNAGASVRHARKSIRPARLLLENHEFWPIHHESLALFLHPKLFYYYHVPIHRIPYSLIIGDTFDVGPLEKTMRDNHTYYVLALSHNNVNLYEGGHYQLKPVYLSHFPVNMKETLNIDEYPKWQEKHVVAPVSRGRGSEAFHGQYNISQTDKTMLAEFFRRIDRRLHPFLTNRQAPLIIGGVNYLLPIYRRVNTYPKLLKDAITGNLEHVSTDIIRRKAWCLVQEGC